MGEASHTEDHDRPEVEGGFARRHIGPGGAERRAMLRALGLASTEALVAAVVPRAVLSGEPLPLPEGRTEQEALAELRAIVAENEVHKSFIGAGYHGCHLPPVILRNLLENPAWYTAYTPYQAEVSQGRLEALLNFQTMIADLTGMEIANASLLDEGTAAAEAMAFCRRLSKSEGPVFFASEACHPQTVDVVRTRAAPLGIELVVGDHRRDLPGLDVFGVLLQYPASTGEIFDYREVVAAAHARGALVAVAADPLSLALLAPPGAFGADVAVGTVQRFGLPMGYGGPHAAYFATREAHRRAIPGRLVGVSVDRDGRTAYRLALQAREQHVRRERATSNICTAPVLPAVIAGLYAAWHGPEGLRAIARRVHRLAAVLAEGLRRLGCAVPTGSFFDTITVRTGERTARVHAAARAAGVNLREVDALTVGVSLDETTTPADVDALWRILAPPGAAAPTVALVEAAAADRIPAGLARRGDLLAHPVFRRHRSETGMLRYLRRLADKDLALDRTMIPLGSCTMKLNATAAMIPLTWEGLSGLHPFAPPDQARGYRRVIADLEAWLAAITGYDAVSLQPNAGSQGEYAGLLVVRAWHESRGEGRRDVCLIPASAHGSNPASAAMAGMRVVVVACDRAGNVDVADLRAKAERHADRLAALMITYPSTHGVFEPGVEEVCEVVHRHGGQVYVDGANMNAMVGLCRPGRFGGDVSHLNLHKTFALPHGGGGPGVGPVAVKRHLAPFLPGHRHAADGGTASARPGAVGPVASAPWGNAGLLAIAWMYIAMMGRDGLRAATEAAILNANYVARRLAPHYPTLYTGPNGMVAHECVLDLRPLGRAAGVTVEDVAKRLIDYGFHAPSVSFPVAGTLMVEPTESEGRAELDRFCAAMIAIREEIRAVEAGAMDARDNPLKNAPHTAADLVAEPWPHPYTRARAVFPAGPAAAGAKYWPPVARVDDAHGDRNLVCACPPLSGYAEAA